MSTAGRWSWARRRATIHELVDTVPVTRAASWLRVGSVWFAPPLIGLLHRVETDILVLHEPNPMALLAFALARPKHRLAIWYHSEVLRSRWRYKLIYEPFLRPAFRRASRIVVSSPALPEYAEPLEAHASRCEVIPFGVDVHLAPAPEGHPAVASVRARWTGPIALFVGRLVPYKGVEFLLRALAESDVAAVIIGDGPLRESLEDLATRLGVDSRTFFLGHVDDGTLSAWYGACDIFVLPSVTPGRGVRPGAARGDGAGKAGDQHTDSDRSAVGEHRWPHRPDRAALGCRRPRRRAPEACR